MPPRKNLETKLLFVKTLASEFCQTDQVYAPNLDSIFFVFIDELHVVKLNVISGYPPPPPVGDKVVLASLIYETLKLFASVVSIMLMGVTASNHIVQSKKHFVWL